MSKQKDRGKGKQGLHIKQRAGRRAFSYQVPPEVAEHLPLGVTMTVVSLSVAEIYVLADQVEPEFTRWLSEKPTKNAL